ncbi:MAG: hypothetical protein KIS66_14255 [Fimbriimonadaceae bacterium]|nr:hypothetical protein [Fimbriimonadaceae bacterium]
MATAYTPGLTVSKDVVVRRMRRLPIKGETLVALGERVEPDKVVARAMIPGPLQTIKLAELMGVEPREVGHFFKFKVGDPIEKGTVVAETKGLFGMFKSTVVSEHTGTVETVSEITGHILIREPSTPVEITAYIEGAVSQVLPAEGAEIETRGAMVQGIFGIGGERFGPIRVAVESHRDLLEAANIQASDAGKILVGGKGLTLAALRRAAEVGAAGVVAGGIRDADLTEFLGYDIGVAITGQEDVNTTLVVTEGFGYLDMAERTFRLLRELEGKRGSVNGATQIRAGVIRPEVIVPLATHTGSGAEAGQATSLDLGTPIRVIREPYFGRLGKVTKLPAELVEVESGTLVRVLNAELENGDDVVVPRANVEIIAT